VFGKTDEWLILTWAGDPLANNLSDVMDDEFTAASFYVV